MTKEERPTEKLRNIKLSMESIFGELDSESDRGCVLVGACSLEESLEGMLRMFMLSDQATKKVCIDPLFQANGALGSFSAKIKIARALDLIPTWIFKDLEIIRKIRNKFAHSWKAADFSSQGIIDLTSQLQGAEFAAKILNEKEKPHIAGSRIGRSRRVKQRPMKIERMRFIMSLSFIDGILTAFSLAANVKPEIRFRASRLNWSSLSGDQVV